jgi:hypothetical protein
VDPVLDLLLLRKSGSTGIEPVSLDLLPGTLTTRPQRRSIIIYIIVLCIIIIIIIIFTYFNIS